jgi:hypothetical protein
MLEIKGFGAEQRAGTALLNAAGRSPYHHRAGRYQCFGIPKHQAAQEEQPGPMAGG